MNKQVEYLELSEKDEENVTLSSSSRPLGSRNRPLYGQVLVALMGFEATLCVGFSGVLLQQLQRPPHGLLDW
ncbi:hypothetical protein C0J52_28247 [Blattella germanica]|nr:hypothetical protein C0J52_28247 [Blattella germanica]